VAEVSLAPVEVEEGMGPVLLRAGERPWGEARGAWLAFTELREFTDEVSYTTTGFSFICILKAFLLLRYFHP
jgi:hypothetical protein